MKLAILLLVCLFAPFLVADDDLTCDLSVGEASGAIFLICPGYVILVMDPDQETDDSANRCKEDQPCLAQWETWTT